MSNKRILLALILAGTVGFLGLHRLYAGRYYTALVQLLLFLAGAAMLWKDLAPLQAMQSSKICWIGFKVIRSSRCRGCWWVFRPCGLSSTAIP